MIKESLEGSPRHQERVNAPQKVPITAKLRHLLELLRLFVEFFLVVSLIFSGWTDLLSFFQLLPFAFQCDATILAVPTLLIRSRPSLDGGILGEMPEGTQVVVSGLAFDGANAPWLWVEYYPSGAAVITGWAFVKRYMHLAYTTACYELCAQCLNSQLVDDISRTAKGWIAPLTR